MERLIDAAFGRTRAITVFLICVLVVGALAYATIPKESFPEVQIPTVYVSTSLEGISPEDAERLLVKPLETELAALTGLDSMTGTASEGHASVQLEFDPGFDPDTALDKVREAVDKASNELPTDATDPTVTEVNTALFPILTAILSGPVPERTLNSLANNLKDRLEGLSGVLEVDIAGERVEMLEVLIDPTVFETYNLSFSELTSQISRNNLLIAAGAIENGAGRMVLKVPGLVEDFNDVMEMPVKISGKTVVTFADVAKVRNTFEDPSSFARINGHRALALEVKKRSGANIIKTVELVKAEIAAMQKNWPGSIEINYMQDESKQVKTMLADLESNVIAAVLLVMIVIVWALGLRSSILVGLAIPGAFLAGVTIIYFLGYTMNMVVLFSLILVVGMLVDGAIVTVELADRFLHEGKTPKEAYAKASKRMAWPIIASTATTLSVFFPLLFWSSTVGQFMVFLPITVIFTLTASLFMALIFIPVMGGLIGRRQAQSAQQQMQIASAEYGDPRDIRGSAGYYVHVLLWALKHPGQTVIYTIMVLIASFLAYSQFGNGISFFPDTEPDFVQVELRARDNFSIYEQDGLVRQVEARLLQYGELESVYARTGADRQSDEEVIGKIQLELKEWDTRRPAVEIVEQIREEMRQIPGIDIQVQVQANGPNRGKPITLEVESLDREARVQTIEIARQAMERISGYTDVTDTTPLPGVEWEIRLDRSEAARFGADVALLGQAVQLLTQGITIADYRPDNVEEAVDIKVRFPADERTLAELESLRVPTTVGLIPISNFVSFAPVPRSGTIKRIDQKRVTTLSADVAPGLLVNDQVNKLRAVLEKTELPQNVTWSFAGEAEDQQDAMIFLIGAFFAAIGSMILVLLVQFNSFYHTFVIMISIVFSIAGVLLGLLITGRPFGVVMGGIGVIALAGIVVNNNIVLIDTYNDLKKAGMEAMEAALRTGAQRLRPVVLTSVTTALGLMPMVIGVKIDFFSREVVYGAPSTQMWIELSSSIAGGLLFATLLTLIVTPAMLILGDKLEK